VRALGEAAPHGSPEPVVIVDGHDLGARGARPFGRRILRSVVHHDAHDRMTADGRGHPGDDAGHRLLLVARGEEQHHGRPRRGGRDRRRSGGGDGFGFGDRHEGNRTKVR
jgi:hypothetical protein